MKTNVLIVDDHEPFRKNFHSLLQTIPDIGEILEANNGDMAVTMSKDYHPDLIFMDIAMSKNGLEATEIIHKELPDIKIIILTVHAKKSIVDKAFELGVCGYLLKKM